MHIFRRKSYTDLDAAQNDCKENEVAFECKRHGAHKIKRGEMKSCAKVVKTRRPQRAQVNP